MMGQIVDTELLGQIEPYLAEADASVKRAADRVRVSESSAVVDSPTPVNPGRIEGYKAALESRGVAGQAYLVGDRTQVSGPSLQ